MADVYADIAFGMYHRSVELCPGVTADYDRADNLIGVEVLNARTVTVDGRGNLRFESAEESENGDTGNTE
jgi:hypothetical protein